MSSAEARCGVVVLCCDPKVNRDATRRQIAQLVGIKFEDLFPVTSFGSAMSLTNHKRDRVLLETDDFIEKLGMGSVVVVTNHTLCRAYSAMGIVADADNKTFLGDLGLAKSAVKARYPQAEVFTVLIHLTPKPERLANNDQDNEWETHCELITMADDLSGDGTVTKEIAK